MKQETLHIYKDHLDIKVLTLYQSRLKALLSDLEKLKLCEQTSVIVDIEPIKSMESPAWFRELRSILRQHNLILIGIKNPQLNLEVCKSLKIPVLDCHQQASTKQISHIGKNTYIDSPIRTGQQIFAQDGSLTITNNLHNGSEVAAKNDIYIFGSANGKILAGVDGCKLARIFIASGFPEMISIAGIVLHAEALSPIQSNCQFMIIDRQIIQVYI